MRRLLIFLIAVVGQLFVRRGTLSGPRRILVIKPDHLGDLLLATPALRQLRAFQPEAHIVGLVGPWASFLWRGNHDLSAVLEVPFPGFERTAQRKGFARLQPYLTLLRYVLLL
ncbi:glycosyltransferase family 9 protein, partial [Candidatus Gracilibacteria bacterium]|nr:glycosyltransferase family 9 protein [Candidatus Gracilibacteria bacterium]